MNTALNVSKLNFSKLSGDLIPVVVQHVKSGKILTVAFANKKAIEKTIETGRAHFYSRSRKSLWLKGETSGNFLIIHAIQADCDGDSVIYFAEPTGPACHTGKPSCFFEGDNFQTSGEILFVLSKIIHERKNSGDETSYVKSLFEKHIRKIAQKVGEEGVEVALEAETGADEDLLNESADLLFHLMILLEARGKNLADVTEVLQERMKKE